MAMRSSWEGFLKLSLISIPVRAYNALQPGRGEIHFHQIHKDCGNRIRYQKTCPDHGEVDKTEIVSGYEYDKGKYLEIDPEEIRNLRAEKDDAITIVTFTAPEQLDPLYWSGKTNYLAPNGKVGQKTYALLQQAMAEKNLHAVATMIMSRHDETVVLRPVDNLLMFTVLYYNEQLKHPSAFQDELSDSKVQGEELRLAESLIDASTAKKFDFTQYKDRYTERVSEFVEAKLAGKKPKAVHREKAPDVINIMDALRKSLRHAQGSRETSSGRGNRRHRHARSHAKRKTA